jgi:acyl-CoA thioesterase-1
MKIPFTMFSLRLLYLLPCLLAASCELPEAVPTGPTGNSLAGASKSPVVLCFGDSLTSGGGKIDPYPAQLGRMTGRPVVSSGAGGETLVRGAARFPGVLARANPGVVVIMEGTNDAASGGSLSAAEAALEDMVNRSKAAGAAVLVCTIPPFQKGAQAGNAAAQAFNERIRAVASRQKVALVDIYAAFGARGELTQGDGVHISNAGAAVIAAEVAERL